MASNLRVDSIVPSTGSSVSIGTATGGVNIPGVLTYEDVTNVDSIGIITARSSININAASSGIGITISSGGINVAGIVTATSYRGDGSQLTGISVDPSTAASSAGFLKVLNASTPQIRLNNDASDGATTRAFFGIATGNNNYINGSVANDTVLSARVAGDLLIGCGSTVRMRISENGHVTKPANLCLQYTGTGDITSGDIIYGTKVFDVGTSNAYNTSNGEFTAPVTGVYRIQYEYFAAGAGRAMAGIQKHNGSSWSTVKNGMRVYSISGGSNWASVPTIFYLQLNATEKFKIIHQEGTVHLNTPWNHMTVQLVQ